MVTGFLRVGPYPVCPCEVELLMLSPVWVLPMSSEVTDVAGRKRKDTEWYLWAGVAKQSLGNFSIHGKGG